MEKWESGWDVLYAALADLAGEDLNGTVTIRGIPIRVDAALLRSMARVAYHVGQTAYLARCFRGEAWEYLTIPPGQSAAYNENPILEKTGDDTRGRALMPRAVAMHTGSSPDVPLAPPFFARSRGGRCRTRLRRRGPNRWRDAVPNPRTPEAGRGVR